MILGGGAGIFIGIVAIGLVLMRTRRTL